MSLGEFVTRPLHRTLMRSYGVEVVIEADDERFFEHVIKVARKALVDRAEFGPIGSSPTAYKYSFIGDQDGIVLLPELDAILARKSSATT